MELYVFCGFWFAMASAYLSVEPMALFDFPEDKINEKQCRGATFSATSPQEKNETRSIRKLAVHHIFPVL